MSTFYLYTFVSLLVTIGSNAFYLPGIAATVYMQDHKVELKVNHLSSSKTQLSYDYYKLPFCQPEEIVNAAENLGEVLSGNRIENTAVS
jgi:transmembrane 9 superfamily protein 2/4